MAIDPSRFQTTSVVDTCAVWNILSSNCLYTGATVANCHFVITSFVEYECLRKPRTRVRASDQELVSRLKKEQGKGRFSVHRFDLDDLELALGNQKRLGKGEISSLAFAIKFQRALLTDDQDARKFAKQVGLPFVQTTPHLFSWLIYTSVLSDEDKMTVIREHRELQGDLEKHLEEAYSIAVRYRDFGGNP